MRIPAMLCLTALVLALPAAGSIVVAPTAADAARSARATAALAAREKMDAAVIARDMKTIESLLAPDIILNGPNNRMNQRAEIIANIAAGKVDHGQLERTIEYVAERGKDVILSGQETTRPRDNAQGGKTVHRRFTDIWTETPDGWKIVLRQATAYARE